MEKMRRDATTLAIHARGSREEQQTRTGAPTYLPPWPPWSLGRLDTRAPSSAVAPISNGCQDTAIRATRGTRATSGTQPAHRIGATSRSHLA